MSLIQVLDIILFGALLAILAYLVTRRKLIENSDRGYSFLIVGFGLTAFGAAVNVADDYEVIQRIPVVGDPDVLSFLEMVVGFLGGVAFVSLGLAMWVNSVARLNREIERRIQAEAETSASRLALQISERRFRDFAEAAYDCLWEVDGGHVLRYVSASPLGGLTVDDFVGRPIWDVLGGDTALNAPKTRLLMPTDRPVAFRDFQFRGVGPDGEVRAFSASGIPIFDLSGAFDGYRGSITDITDQRNMETQLRHIQKLDAVGNLTGGIAHDFNNILAIILGNLEFAEDLPAGDPTVRELMGKAIRAANRGASLTHQLLAFSRKQVLEPRETDITGLVNDVVELLYRTLGATIEIEIVHAPNLWSAEIDPGQLENALVNLAINARDAMPHGGKLTFEISNIRLDDDYADSHIEVKPGQYVLIAVSDTGNGMSPDTMSKIFEPFYTTKGRGKGTGLGLSMVYGLVKQSNGHISVYSEPGEGTTFKIYLPRSRNADAPNQRNAADRDQEAPCTGTIMVVEDDIDVRTVLVNILDGIGYEVLEASSGVGALEQLNQTNRVNLLFTDIVLPGELNGRELAEKAAEIRPGIKTLFMSGYTHNAVVHHGRLDQGVKFVQKPFRRKDIERKVREALAA